MKNADGRRFLFGARLTMAGYRNISCPKAIRTHRAPSCWTDRPPGFLKALLNPIRIGFGRSIVFRHEYLAPWSRRLAKRILPFGATPISLSHAGCDYRPRQGFAPSPTIHRITRPCARSLLPPAGIFMSPRRNWQRMLNLRPLTSFIAASAFVGLATYGWPSGA